MFGPAATRDGVLLFGRRMEALGYHSLWVSDHVVIPGRIRSRYPYNATGDFPLAPDTDFLEPLTVLALVAGATGKIRLGTSVLVLPHRHPVLAAKMLATLDHLAPGRVILGAGVGWMQEEIELLGVPYARRGAWSDEALRVMRASWRDGRASFTGEFDGWHAAFPSVDKMKDGMARLREACRRAGRDPATLTVSARVGLPARRASADVLAEVRALRDLGVAHIILETGGRYVAQMVATCERFASEVRPQLA